MIFGSKNKRQESPLHNLNEEDIRNRLYGSAVGMAVDIPVEFPKEAKGRDEKSSPKKRKLESERTKIQEELESLRKDLERTRRKLDRMRGVRSKKIRLLAIYLAAFLTAVILAAVIIRQYFIAPREAAPPAMVESAALYSIQVAVYGDAADAQGLSAELNSKGYRAFIKESRFKTGKIKYTVYAGSFKDKKAASEILNRLRTAEGIKDSFIASLPE